MDKVNKGDQKGKKDMAARTKKRKGRGWHGFPEEHARAGRKGGLKRAENLQKLREAA